jgi:putative molybdenum carrier protein
VLAGGSKRTAAFAAKHRKPWIHIYQQGNYSPEKSLLDFLREHGIEVLNVAGSRASKEPAVGAFVKQVFEAAFFPRPSGLIGGPGEG